MKLNNKGWGLQALLVCIIILMIALIIVAVLVEKAFGTLGITPGSNNQTQEESKPKQTYQNLEDKVIEATKKYHDKYYTDMLDSEKISVTLKTLKKQNMLNSIYDLKATDKECSGYAIFILKNDKITYNAYIKCENYTTKGYLEHMDI